MQPGGRMPAAKKARLYRCVRATNREEIEVGGGKVGEKGNEKKNVLPPLERKI